MRHLIYASLALFAGSAQAVPVVIDFEEFTPDVAINPPSGDAVSKGFFLDYLDEGLAGNPVVLNAASSPNGTQVYMNCPNCVPVEQIDVSVASGGVFDIFSIDVGAANVSGSFDFAFTGFLSGGGTVSTSTINASAMQTVNFNSSWSGLDSFRIEISPNTVAGPFTGSIIDNISVEVVPIPAAIWLFGSGLAGLGFLRRRRH